MYFSPPRPRVLAHRGFTHSVRTEFSEVNDENTLGAFHAAVAEGSQYLETDVRSTKDGVAVLCHDPKFVGRDGRQYVLRESTAAELAEIELESGGRIPTLFDALTTFERVRFNIDVKERAAVGPCALAIRQAGAIHRVLVTSFSRSRRRSVIRQLPAVHSGASQRDAVVIVLSALLGLKKPLSNASREIQAIQIPGHKLLRRALTTRHIRLIQQHNIEVHVWTLNTADEMEFWLERGVDGVVTDHVDVALEIAKRFPL